MDSQTFLERISRNQFFRHQVIDVKLLPARAAEYGDLEQPLSGPVSAVLDGLGISCLYSHQVAAINSIRSGSSIVVVTGTASGKTLCYTIPVMERLVAESKATMLFVYPTKALAQDQLRALAAYRQDGEGIAFLAGAYDGDTPATLRRGLRDGGNIILTNPDMLHQGILPHHARWNRFFANLRYVVIDEVHAYRGVFGSHLANVIRRLRRVCRHYGSAPQFICCSATIANPLDHAQRVTGCPMELIDNDGSPRGPKHFVFWNPPPLKQSATGDPADWRIGGDRRSPVGEAVHLMSTLIKEGVQTIAFVRTRLAAELIFRDCRERLRPVSKKLAESVQAYRGGYLPEERREIERRLAAREILGVSSTNALELGIDIGTLDASILVGYPGTVASLWQQAGRAGRKQDGALVFLLAQNAPMDQYLMANPDWLFGRHPENAVVDPDNPHIIIGHLKCAAQELPLPASDAELFGPYASALLELLSEEGQVRAIKDHWYWSSSEFAAAGVNLRNIAGPVYTIHDETGSGRVIGTMDEVSALSQLHNHAVYLHRADTYSVSKLDIERKIAYVERRDLDYYTQSVQTSQIRIDEKETEEPWRGGLLGYGDVTVTTSIPMFRKIKFHSRDSLGYETLELPPQELETVAFWMVPSEGIAKELTDRGMLMGEALIGIANVLLEVAPLFVMCDTQDIGTVVDSRNLGRDALFFHDRYPGGMGYARRCLERFDEMVVTIAEVVRNCSCPDGCPSCVGSAIPPSAMTDLDSGVRGRIPDKTAARVVLEILLGIRS